MTKRIGEPPKSSGKLNRALSTANRKAGQAHYQAWANGDLDDPPGAANPPAGRKKKR